LQATFLGEADTTAAAAQQAMPPITLPERLGACLLLASTIVLGLYPRILMDLILPSLNSPLFEQLRQGAWR
jgi:NADH-quinone oxidoreductase subunit M